MALLWLFSPRILLHLTSDIQAAQVFVNTKGSLYAFKGLAGRLGPIGVHASMLAIMAGVAWGGLSGWKGSAMVPQGAEFLMADALRGASPLARLPGGASPSTASMLAHTNLYSQTSMHVYGPLHEKLCTYRNVRLSKQLSMVNYGSVAQNTIYLSRSDCMWRYTATSQSTTLL